MREVVTVYFEGEKSAGQLIAIIGLLGLSAAALFFQPRYELRPLAITLGVLGLLELAIGVGLFLKTGPQVERLLAELASNAPRFYASESARMAKVQKNFVTLEIAWVVIIIVSAIVAWTQKTKPVVSGIALGLLLNASFLMIFDIVAERRGAIYERALAAPQTK